jgi:hypothetical protein
MKDEMVEELQRLEQSFDKAFGRAEELNAVFEKSEKPRQRIIIEILRKHNLPAFLGPFFDAYFRITVEGGDIEKLTILMIARLSAYLGEDEAIVAQRHKAAVADYIEFMSQDLRESSRFSSGEQPFMPADG